MNALFSEVERRRIACNRRPESANGQATGAEPNNRYFAIPSAYQLSAASRRGERTFVPPPHAQFSEIDTNYYATSLSGQEAV
jgi:hypothetical protein